METASVPADREIIVSREFNFPRELLWDAMTTAEHVSQWWGPTGFTTSVDEMDVRVGGIWRLVMHGPDGTDYPNESVFTEVVKPERISYSLKGGREGAPHLNIRFTWTFEEIEPEKSRATIYMVFDSAADRETAVKEFGALEGAEQTLGRLAGQLESTPFVIERVFDAPVEVVWKAISEKELMKEWYFEIENFKAEVGAEFGFTVEHEGHCYEHLCVVKTVVPQEKLAYTWRYAGVAGDSLVTFELFPEGGKTRVRLTHEGLGNFPKEPAYARKNFARGWGMLIGEGLKEFLGK